MQVDSTVIPNLVRSRIARFESDDPCGTLLQFQRARLVQSVEYAMTYLAQCSQEQPRGKFADRVSPSAAEQHAREVAYMVDMSVAMCIIDRPEAEHLKSELEHELIKATAGKRTIFPTRMR